MLRLLVIADLNVDGARFRDFLLWDCHSEDAVFVVGFHVLGVDGFRQAESPHKRTIRAFNAMETFAILLLLKFALALEGQGAVFELNGYILGVNFRDIRLQDQFVLGLIDVNRG